MYGDSLTDLYAKKVFHYLGTRGDKEIIEPFLLLLSGRRCRSPTHTSEFRKSYFPTAIRFLNQLAPLDYYPSKGPYQIIACTIMDLFFNASYVCSVFLFTPL